MLPTHLSLETLVASLDTFGNKTNSLGLEALRMKTKVSDLGAYLSVHSCSEDNEVNTQFPYLGSVLHNSELTD